MEQGFIVLHRKITDNWLWLSESFTKSQAWVDLLLLANHSEGSFFIRGVKVVVKRGHVGKSEESLSQRWKWSRGKTRTFLKVLETEQQIKQHKSPVLNIIEILNYDSYQKLDNRQNNRKTTERQQKDTNNKEITIIKEEQEKELPVFIDKNLLNDFFGFRESVATKKKPFTQRAKELILKDLAKFENIKTGFANLALENSIKNSWIGVFEPKNNSITTDSLVNQINSITGSSYILTTYEQEGVLKIKCKNPVSKDKIYELPKETKDKIKALLANQKFEFVC